MIFVRTLAVLALLTTAHLAAHANAIDTAAVAPTLIGPSADAFSLNAASTTMSPVVTQSGTFVVGDSGSLVGNFSFSFIDNVTINGITSAVTVYGSDNVTLNFDTLSILGTGPIPIGDGTWSLRPFEMTGYDIKPYDVTLTSDVTNTVTPEPAGLLLLGTGALATALTVRRRLFAL